VLDGRCANYVPWVPFFRVDAPQRPQETSFYVISRLEAAGCRWISFQESQEQEIIAPDDELLGLIAHGRMPGPHQT